VQGHQRQPDRDGRAAAAGGRAALRAGGRPDRAAGLHAPRCWRPTPVQGFLLLTDLGQQCTCDALQTPRRGRPLMREALQALVQWQQPGAGRRAAALRRAAAGRELALFPEWCVQREFGITWTTKQQQPAWQRVCQLLTQRAGAAGGGRAPRLDAAQPDGVPTNPGILDFQDAVRGPHHLRPGLAAARRLPVLGRGTRARLGGALVATGPRAPACRGRTSRDFGEFWRQLEWMGLQRHLKVLGIFCRLKHRDGKPAYARTCRASSPTPRVALRYRPLKPLLRCWSRCRARRSGRLHLLAPRQPLGIARPA
jgi:aminoglycoside/choline kinase family phosphotransferase